jgi:hypothetical protein
VSRPWRRVEGRGESEEPPRGVVRGGSESRVGGDVLSHRVAPAVPSALWGLTAVFGMGTGVTPTLWPPTQQEGPGF